MFVGIMGRHLKWSGLMANGPSNRRAACGTSG